MKQLIGFVIGVVLISLTLSKQVKADEIASADQADTTISQAITRFEDKYGRRIQAPTDLPVLYTHQKGRVNDNEAKLELEYTYESETLLIFIDEREELLSPTEYHEIVKLQDGTKAFYRVSNPGFHQLHFRKGDLDYKIWASSKSQYVTSSKQLVNVANSIL